jgi:ABC-type lipoprotein export system ATPase subunit
MTSDCESLVHCIDVARTFGHGRAAVVAVHGVNCIVRAGEQIALMGPSGSGKSSLLHLMGALDRPTSGTISWPALGAAGDLRPGPLGMIFQGPSLLAPLDVAENVALPLLLQGGDPEIAVAAARVALARLDLTALTDKLPEELSGGQAQRVAVARVLASAPRLILADEPTGQLDHAAGAQVIDVLLTAAAETGAALIVSTHDPAIAHRLPIRWEMADGRLLGTELEGAACSA